MSYLKSTGAKFSSTKDLPKGRWLQRIGRSLLPQKAEGPTSLGPSQFTGLALFITLFLVEPVLRSGEVLRPIVNVEISAPGAIGLVIIA
jgi:hypothetical protein